LALPAVAAYKANGTLTISVLPIDTNVLVQLRSISTNKYLFKLGQLILPNCPRVGVPSPIFAVKRPN
jgi:hypothetical protein